METEEKVAIGLGIAALIAAGTIYYLQTRKEPPAPPEGGEWRSEGIVLAKTLFTINIYPSGGGGGYWVEEGEVAAQRSFSFTILAREGGGYWVDEGEVAAKKDFRLTILPVEGGGYWVDEGIPAAKKDFRLTILQAPFGFTLRLEYVHELFIGEKYYWASIQQKDYSFIHSGWLGIDDTWQCPYGDYLPYTLSIGIYNKDYELLDARYLIGPVYAGKNYVYNWFSGKLREV